MSSLLTVDKPPAVIEPAAPSPTPSSRRLRLWPILIATVLFWLFVWGTRAFDMSMFARFMSRLAAYAVFLLFSIGWWFSRRAVPLRDRFGALAVIAIVGVVTSMLADQSLSPFGLFMAAFPAVVTAGIAWLAISRSLTAGQKRAGFCLTMVIVCGYFALLRFDGLDGRQRSETSWRWQPTKEQVFLAAHESAAVSDGQLAESPASPWKPAAGDCLEYRGARRDGIVNDGQVRTDWETVAPKVVWRQKAGPSWSGLIVVDGHVVTQEQRGDTEVVACLDAATGTEIWVHEDPVRFEESLSGAGPRGTPTFADGRIFALGGKGNLNCLEAATGKVLWAHDIVADAGVATADTPQWGYSNSPLVVDGLVIVFAGGGDKSVLAYRVENGELAWTCEGGKQSYSSPQLVTFDGIKQVLMHDNKALQAIDPTDGTVLWSYPNGGEMSLPMLQPHQVGETNSFVISTEPGAARLDVKHDGDKWTVERVWDTNRFRPGFNDFVIHKGHMYGLDDGILCAFDLSTGERLWKKGRLGHGQVLVLVEQDVLLASSNRGAVVLVAANPEAYEELARFEAIEGKTWNGPVLVEGRVYLRNGEEIAAYEIGATSQAVSVPAN